MNQLFFSQPHFPLLVATLFVLTTGATAGAQDYDELFAQTDDQSFEFFDQVDENVSPDFGAADQKTEIESLPVPARATDSDTSRSHRHVNGGLRNPSDLRLSGRSGSQSVHQQPTAMQIRQARALAEMRSRDARLEAERWGLLPSLRPSWPSNLMMNTRNSANITYIVPVYIRGR